MGLNTTAPTGTRKHLRVTIDLSVRVFAEGATNSLARGHDISCGGMCLYTPLELAVGEVIRVGFELPNSRMRFGVSAVVRNRYGFRYGIEFANLTRDELEELKRVTGLLSLLQH